jgi:hypothetical protein
MGELTELALYAGAAAFVWLVVMRLRREHVSAVGVVSPPARRAPGD